jgi:hypothetical protein
MYDEHDDDPCDCNPSPSCSGCYADLFPNPVTDAPDQGPTYDPMEKSDWHEWRLGCQNDGDPSVQTPIISGYMIYVDSQNFPTPGLGTSVGLGSIGTPDSAGSLGARFRGAWFDDDPSQADWPYRIVPETMFGSTIAIMPDYSAPNPNVPDSWFGNEIIVSAPGSRDQRGQVLVFSGQDMTTFDVPASGGQAPFFNSVPHYFCFGGDNRGLTYPGYLTFVGASPGDNLGYADSAGDYNRDGNQDIVMGAPGADRDGLFDNGLIYIVLMRADQSGAEFETQNPPRVEIHGVQQGEQLGRMNKYLRDIDGDTIPDIGFGDAGFSPNGLDGAGQVGIVFGGRFLTGEATYKITDIATTRLPGCRFLGTQVGGKAGTRIASAGDFNADGYGDLLVVAPNETRQSKGQVRRGVVYLVFGGPHLYNQVFQLTEVGSSRLPGVIFVSPHAVGSADEATIEAAEAAGDVDGDGFGDILLGVPAADYINPAAPNQRRLDSGEAYLVYGTSAIATR